MDSQLEEMSAFFDKRHMEYDIQHLQGIDGGQESKQVIASFLPEGTKAIIDFGIGTGLELDWIFKRFPDVKVTGLDISKNMLKILREKYPEKDIDLHCINYFDYNFGEACYDAAISVMTLHHYTHEVKTELYRKIRGCLNPDGMYIECDYMLTGEGCEDPQQLEDFYFSEFERLKKEQGKSDKLEYHCDTPCTVSNQKKMLLEAGFSSVEEAWRVKDTVILIARI